MTSCCVSISTTPRLNYGLIRSVIVDMMLNGSVVMAVVVLLLQWKVWRAILQEA